MILPGSVNLKNSHRSIYKGNGFFRQFGPAWLVMMADVDAACIISGAQTGALYGYGLIWLFIVLTVPLYIVQELAGRISIATRKGLGSVIRDNYGGKISILMTLPMAITDVVTYVIEYIGIAVGLEIIGLSLFMTIPVIYVIHILIVTKRKYVKAERPLIVVSLILLVSFAMTLILRGFQPINSPLSDPFMFLNNRVFFFLLAANVGAVVMPFMLFFQASATGIKARELNLGESLHEKRKSLSIMRKETLVGAVVTEVLMIIIEMTFSGVKNAGNSGAFATAENLGAVLTPIAGKFSLMLFGIGLISASFVALVVISLASAWGLAESMRIRKESVWLIYVIESFPAVIVALLIPSDILVNAALYLLVSFVAVLIGPMLILGFIGQNRSIMGWFVSNTKQQILYWTVFFLIISSIIIYLAY